MRCRREILRSRGPERRRVHAPDAGKAEPERNLQIGIFHASGPTLAVAPCAAEVPRAPAERYPISSPRSSAVAARLATGRLSAPAHRARPRVGAPPYSGRATFLEPALERFLALAGPPSGQEALDADVFVKRGPVNAHSAPDEAPPCAFALAAMEKTRVPDQRHCHRPAILEPDGELVVRHLDVDRPWGLQLTR